MAEATFAPLVISEFSGGWVTNLDRESDALRPNESPDLENVVFDGQGSFAVRKGYQLMGNRLTSAGSILRLWTFRRAIIDDEILIRQRAQTLEYYHTGTLQWETLPHVGTITTNTKVGFANYTSSSDTVDYVYFCDGSGIALQRWDGAFTMLDGALAGGEGTITVDSTTGFLSAGTLDVGGTSVTYTGKTATTFTGCVGTPVAADNIAIEQKADNFSAGSGSKPSGNILEVVNSQLAVASKQFVKLSDVDDFTAWGAGLATSQGFTGGRITGLKAKDKKLIVFTPDTIQAMDYEFTGDLTGFQVRIENIENTSGYGAKVFTGVTSADGQVFYPASDGTIRQVVRSDVSALFDTGSISENIKNTLATYTLSGSAGIFYKGKLLFSVQSDEASINDIIVVNDLKYAKKNPSSEAWTKWRIYSNDFAIYGGALYFASSADPNVYRMFTDSDGADITDDDGAAIPWYYSTPQIDFGKPELKWVFYKLVSRGFITQNSEVTYKILYDYGVTGEAEQQFLGSNQDYVLIPAGGSLGEEVIGEGGLDEDSFNGFFPFTYPTDYGSYDAYNVQLIISGQTKNEKYKQTRLVLYVEAQDDVMTK